MLLINGFPYSEPKENPPDCFKKATITHFFTQLALKVIGITTHTRIELRRSRMTVWFFSKYGPTISFFN
ncbi:MAG: hypothetical protein CSA68_12435 [Rhodobacterales bacterium]|nr:MAG: hypothetical protein CSA68_12435 [Rhodobacterales bacterium]